MFGGNSNWRGPAWMPVNGLLIRGLLDLFGRLDAATALRGSKREMMGRIVREQVGVK